MYVHDYKISSKPPIYLSQRMPTPNLKPKAIHIKPSANPLISRDSQPPKSTINHSLPSKASSPKAIPFPKHLRRLPVTLSPTRSVTPALMRVAGVIVARSLVLTVCWRLLLVWLLLHILAGRHVCLALLVSTDALANGVDGVGDAAVFDTGFE
jgi:hypothetical protein